MKEVMPFIDIRGNKTKPTCVIFGDVNSDSDAMCVRKYAYDGGGAAYMAISDNQNLDVAEATAYIKSEEDARNLIKAIEYYISNIGWK